MHFIKIFLFYLSTSFRKLLFDRPYKNIVCAAVRDQQGYKRSATHARSKCFIFPPMYLYEAAAQKFLIYITHTVGGENCTVASHTQRTFFDMR